MSERLELFRRLVTDPTDEEMGAVDYRMLAAGILDEVDQDFINRSVALALAKFAYAITDRAIPQTRTKLGDELEMNDDQFRGGLWLAALEAMNEARELDADAVERWEQEKRDA